MRKDMYSKNYTLKELLDDFYEIYSVNMRDLGSPVHSKQFFKILCDSFDRSLKIGVVYYKSIPVAAGIISLFRDFVEIPWASSLRKYNRLSPNMLLYWSFIEYCSNNGFKYFDFGRSSPDEGAYKFKKQWGAKPQVLNWHYLLFNDQKINEDYSEKSKFDKAIQYWQKLPMPVTKIIGPMIRKHIGL